jgi:hypothetical protein
MKLIQKILLGALTLSTPPAFADTACYTPEQVHAEQLLRLHSELMVIAITCRQGSDGQDLSAAYVSFTQKNLRELHGAEQTMLAYYKAEKKGNAVENLDSLRTRLGNEAGQKVAQMAAPEFCAQYRDWIGELNSVTPRILDNQIRYMETSESAFAKPCGERHKAKKGG